MRSRVAPRAATAGANRTAIEAAGLSFILGMKFTHVLNEVVEWRKAHAGADIPDRHVFVQPWPPGLNETRRHQVIYYEFKGRPGSPHVARHRTDHVERFTGAVLVGLGVRLAAESR